jgi:hypothetical protein
MYASEKYMLDVIKIECNKFLTVNINDVNACMVLQTAHNFHLEDSDSIINLTYPEDRPAKLVDPRQDFPCENIY